MEKSFKIQYEFLKWFLIFVILEAAIFVNLINCELFVFKLLLNYLFILALLPIIYEKLRKNTIDIFSPLVVFTAVYLILFFLRALDLLIFQKKVIIEDEKFYVVSLIFSIIGLHFFHVGYFSNLGYAIYQKRKIFNWKWSIKKLKKITFVYSFISIFSLFLIIRLSGGILYHIRNLRESLVNVTSNTTILVLFVIIVKIPLIIWFSELIDRKKIPLFFYLYFIFVMIILLLIGERGPFAFLVLSVFVCYHYIKNKVRPISILGIIVMILLFLFAYGQYRDFTQQVSKGTNFKLKLKPELIYHYIISHFDQINHFKDIIKYTPDKVDFQYGKTYLNFLVKPIPSLVWENKPQGAGRIVTRYIYPKAYNLNVTFAPSILGELYINFHLIGIIVGMFLFGLMIKILHIFLNNNLVSKNAIVVYSICVPSIIVELRGDFNVFTTFFLFELIFLIVALRYISTK